MMKGIYKLITIRNITIVTAFLVIFCQLAIEGTMAYGFGVWPGGFVGAMTAIGGAIYTLLCLFLLIKRHRVGFVGLMPVAVWAANAASASFSNSLELEFTIFWGIVISTYFTGALQIVFAGFTLAGFLRCYIIDPLRKKS